MLKNFNIESFKKEKPPKDNSLKTMSEISSIKNIPDDKKFVKINDDVSKRFNEVVKDKDIDVLIEESVPHILKLKKYFNRPRPKDIAKTFGIKLKDIELKSMKTPSYPSGHSTQAYLISDYLKSKHPEKSKKLDKVAKDICYSRNVAKAHYKSDSNFGKKLGLAMSKHIKEQ
tara:strand:+ start:23 stop:538 length:516 start_codon:yes stop_codon:yes gene_type:complete